MANFCGHCGASNEGGAFCSSCGRPLDAAPPTPPPGEQTVVRPAPATPPPPDPTTQFPATPPAPQPPQPPQQPQQPASPDWGPPPGAPQPPPPAPPTPPQQSYPPQAPVPQQPPGWAQAPAGAPGYPAAPGYPPQQHAPSAPKGPKVNPFQGWPLTDYARDAAAAFAFLACLGMPWDYGDRSFGLEVFNHAGERWWVVIAALLGLVSLAVPYVAKAGLVGGWSAQQYRLVKLGLNVPFVLSVLVAVLLELIHLGDPLEGGLGSAIGMGLLGVALAVQPRQSEDPTGADDRLWNLVSRITTMAAVGLTILLFVLWVLHGAISDDVEIFDPFTGFLAVFVAALLTPLAVVGWPALGTLTSNGSAAWRRVLATSGFTIVVIALFALASNHSGLFLWPEVEKWDGYGGGYAPGAGVLLVGAAAAFAVSWAQIRSTERLLDPVTGWVQTVRSALLVSAATSVLFALAMLLAMFAADDVAGSGIAATVLALVAAGAAGFGTTLLSDVRKNRVVLLGILAGILVLGFVVMGIVNGDDLQFAWINSGWQVAAWITLPALAAWALLGPQEVRAALGPLVTPSASAAAPGYPQQPPPPAPGPYDGPPPGYPAQQPPPPATQPPQAPPPPSWGPPPTQ